MYQLVLTSLLKNLDMAAVNETIPLYKEPKSATSQAIVTSSRAIAEEGCSFVYGATTGLLPICIFLGIIYVIGEST